MDVEFGQENCFVFWLQSIIWFGDLLNGVGLEKILKLLSIFHIKQIFKTTTVVIIAIHQIREINQHLIFSFLFCK